MTSYTHFHPRPRETEKEHESLPILHYIPICQYTKPPPFHHLMMGSMRSNVDIDSLLSQLTREEKVSLLSATDWWRTPVIQRDGFTIPHIKVRYQLTEGKTSLISHARARPRMDQMERAARATSAGSRQLVSHAEPLWEPASTVTCFSVRARKSQERRKRNQRMCC